MDRRAWEADIFRIPIDSSGSLAITTRPRGGDWLDDDIEAMARQGVGVLVSLLCAEELSELGLEDEARVCLRHQIEFVSLPVPDLGTPADSATFLQVVQRIAGLIHGGACVAVHCRQSVGRSGLLTVAIAVTLGIPLESALDIVSRARGVPVPETRQQVDWLCRNVVNRSGTPG